jgi:hypothetical protein
MSEGVLPIQLLAKVAQVAIPLFEAQVDRAPISFTLYGLGAVPDPIDIGAIRRLAGTVLDAAYPWSTEYVLGLGVPVDSIRSLTRQGWLTYQLVTTPLIRQGPFRPVAERGGNSPFRPHFRCEETLIGTTRPGT